MSSTTRALIPTTALFALAGCPRTDPVECTEFEQVFVYEDNDGDSFGSEVGVGYVCRPGPNQSTNTVDCDDTREDVNPTADEVCDDLDNDCDAAVDEAHPKLPYYRDADEDGFGSLAPRDVVTACTAPSGHIAVSGDCDDDDPAINPAIHEVCNDGIDDDCDGAADDDDGSVDPTTQHRYFPDDDLDGYGDDAVFADLCVAPLGAVLVGGDCDDARDTTHPDADEVCNQRDDDCDTLVDQQDPSLPPEELVEYFTDLDGDHHGDPLKPLYTCDPSPPGPQLGDDCDDSDPLVLGPLDWLEDADGDGFGSALVLTACARPGGPVASAERGVDCEDADPSVHPDASDVCYDGLDQDCSGDDRCKSCGEWLGSDPASPSGVYAVEPQDGVLTDVWCDMDTDGGGWTLVASTSGATLNDAGTETPYADLQTLFPAAGQNRVWSGLRDLAPDQGDLRFACKQAALDPVFEVDLSFYDVHWYSEITTGVDADSCFSQGNGAGDDQPEPARRDNVTGAFLPAGDAWGAGFLEGEDNCSDLGDFTVDFDDRGKDSNQTDGTDWGEDDGVAKCGDGSGESFFLFYREP